MNWIKRLAEWTKAQYEFGVPMTLLRQALIIAYIGILVTTFLAFLLGATGVIAIKPEYITPLVTTLIAEVIAPVAVILRDPSFWKDDPDSIAKLRRNHAEEITRLKAAHEQEKFKLREEYEAAITKLNREKLELSRQTSGRALPLSGFTITQ
ncbi:MAG: hypothetical protein WDM96_04915 [Lacunisphaera sp.]